MVTLVFIIFFFTILELPAILFLGIWILQQAVFAYFDLFQPQGNGGGVAYFAHLGGAAFGLLSIRLFARRRRQERGADMRVVVTLVALIFVCGFGFMTLYVMLRQRP